jgi:uncharacterized membrane protein
MMGGFGAMGGGGVGFLVLLGLLVWAVVSSMRRVGPASSSAPDPRALLDERLARGEISVEEYRKLCEALK